MFEKLAQIAGLLRNLPKLQEETEKLKQSVGQITAEGEAGAGMVKVKVNGRHEVLKVELTDEAKSGDRELLEELIRSAVNQAMQKLQGQVAQEYAKLAANMGLPPGMMGMGMPGMF
jgi:DNA-binding YbaB/EbfC family protein